MTPLGSLDVMRMVWWWSHHWRSLDEGRLRIIDGNWTHPEYPKWGTVKQLINKAKRLSENNGFRIVSAIVEQQEPHTAADWLTGLSDEAIVYIPLSCVYPATVLYEGIQQMALIPGQVVAVGSNNGAMRSIANHGDAPAVSMVLTLRRDQEE